MKYPIFYVTIDKCINWYTKMNKSMQDLCGKYKLIMLSSNTNYNIIKNKYPKAELIHSKYNSFPHKTILLFEYLKNIRYDFLIRLDMDSIIYDIDRILQVSNKYANRIVYVGNKKTLKNRIPKFFRPHNTYIRGACNVTTKNTIDFMRTRLDVNYGAKPFDLFFCKNLIENDIQLIDDPLFEINTIYTGRYPVWHPQKHKKKYLFKKQIEQYKNMTNYNIHHDANIQYIIVPRYNGHQPRKLI